MHRIHLLLAVLLKDLELRVHRRLVHFIAFDLIVPKATQVHPGKKTNAANVASEEVRTAEDVRMVMLVKPAGSDHGLR